MKRQVKRTPTTETDTGELEPLRQAIDAIDAELLDLINRRAALARRIGDVKRERGEQTTFYRPEREAQILRRIAHENAGPLGNEEAIRLLREIMSACLALERPLTIAYLGPQGTFTQSASEKHFGKSVVHQAFPSVEEVFREVESGSCDFGVVPIENSLEGVVSHTLDMFIGSQLSVCGEVEIRVHHCLLAAQAELGAVVRVYAHQHALAQCRRWLISYLPAADTIPVSSNAEGARRAAQDPGAAAIASEVAAELYALQVVAANIEDDPNNTTRFLVIGQRQTAPSGDDKTSLLFSTPNKPGALHGALNAFAEHGISMTRIESRPSRRGTWDYLFFVDIEGHIEDPAVVESIHALERTATMVKHLGSYPRAVL